MPASPASWVPLLFWSLKTVFPRLSFLNTPRSTVVVVGAGVRVGGGGPLKRAGQRAVRPGAAGEADKCAGPGEVGVRQPHLVIAGRQGGERVGAVGPGRRRVEDRAGPVEELDRGP